ncbi:hypothetical protein DV735_g2873, partial [Chaetothyriales sp. CBS 134920]
MAMSNLFTAVQASLLLFAPAPVISAGTGDSTPTATATSYAPQFTVPESADYGQNILPNIKDPNATVAQEVCPGYLASHVQTSSTGLTAQLTLAGPPCYAYGTDIQDLTLTVEFQTEQRLHVNIVPSHITAENKSWYILPTEYVRAAGVEGGSTRTSDLVFSWSQSSHAGFGFNVTRRSTDEIIFSTTGTKLVFENQFIELVAHQSPAYNLYGLGEVIHALRLGNQLTRTLYASDAGDPIDGNIYGSHPFYLQTKYYDHSSGSPALVTEQLNTTSATGNYTSSSSGVYLRNSHGMEILLHPTNVTWRTIGGSIDLYFFSGPTAADVTRQYLDVVGRPALQQYWVFGYHQCRWGYQNWSVTEEVVKTYEAFGIPQETIWNDIDYMKQYRNFENDPIRFGYEAGAAFLQRLHDSGRHYIPIIDSAIYHPNPDNESDAYGVYDDGVGSYLLNPDGSEYIGDVWPGYTVFPDWLAQSARDWWREQVVKYHSQLPIDGIWIDMNEASSFCVGSCGTGNLSLNPVHPPFQLGGEPGNIIYDYPEGFNITNATAAASASSASAAQASSASKTAIAAPTYTGYFKTTPTPGERNINWPPYAINNIQSNGDLAAHAVSPNATHHNGVVEYDVHNLHGHLLLNATYYALLAASPNNRPVIIGRSTFPGSGTVAGHWGGDNASKFYYMYFSIPQALSFSLFGIPFFGADTCGFNGNADEELCNRWMQLSALFPFYRNHNTLSALPQEAYNWASVITATKTAMSVRFALLPYLYTLFWHANQRGDTVMRALAWEFPNDPSLADADRQFFLGPSILVTPVLVQGAKSVNGVFPGLVEGTDTYYDWYTRSQVIDHDQIRNKTIAAPLGHLPVYIRGGAVLALQQLRLTTRDARQSGWSVLVAPAIDGSSTGSLYLDDGESVAPNATKTVSLTANGLHLSVSVSGNYVGLDHTPLGNVTFLGVTKKPANLTIVLNGHAIGQAVWNSTAGTVFAGQASHGHAQLSQSAWSKDWTLSVG